MGEEIRGSVGGVDGIGYVVDMVGAFGSGRPGWGVGEEIGQDEVDSWCCCGGSFFLCFLFGFGFGVPGRHPAAFGHAIAGAGRLSVLVDADVFIDLAFYARCRAPGASAEVDKSVGRKAGSEESLEGVRYKGRRRGGLEWKELGLPAVGQAGLDFFS